MPSGALCGIAICPEIEQTFPETAGGGLMTGVLWYQLLVHVKLGIPFANFANSVWILPCCAVTGQLRHHRLVSSRAEEVTASFPKFIANSSVSSCLHLFALEEGIPEDAPEYGPARNEARFSWHWH